MQFKLKTLATTLGLTALCLAGAANATMGDPQQYPSHINNTDAMFIAASDCDQSNNPALLSIQGKLPLSLHESMNKPTLRELMDTSIPSAEQQELIRQYSDKTQGCMADISWLVNKNFSPRFAQAWRNYSYKMMQLNARLARGAESFGDARRMAYSAATVLQNELDEYRYQYTDGKQSVPSSMGVLDVCVKRTNNMEPSDALAYSLRRTADVINREARCAKASEHKQSEFEKSFYGLD